jgi:hypothetical protein
MTGREKGTATMPCPHCGNELAAIAQADGSLAGETCKKCYGGVEKASQQEEVQGREVATPEAEGAVTTEAATEEAPTRKKKERSDG